MSILCVEVKTATIAASINFLGRWAGAETRAAHFHRGERHTRTPRSLGGGLTISIFVNGISQILWSHLR